MEIFIFALLVNILYHIQMSNQSQLHRPNYSYFIHNPNICYINPFNFQSTYTQQYFVPFVTSSQIIFSYQNAFYKEIQLKELKKQEIAKDKTQFVISHESQLMEKIQKNEKQGIKKIYDKQFIINQQMQRVKITQRDRNVLSNSLKLFIKKVRIILNKNKKTYEEINDKLPQDYPIQKFEIKFNYYFPNQKNYIRPSYIKAILLEQNKQFSYIFKIMLKKFYRQLIYLPQRKLTKMKRLIRVQHIKAGRQLLDYFFISNQNNQC